MEPDVIDEILIEIVKEFTQPQNFQRILDEQVLANAIFYSFAIGILNKVEDSQEAIEDLQYVRKWIEDKQDILIGFKVSDDDD